MKVEYINPFIKSIGNTFSTMLDCELHRGDIGFKDNANPKYAVSGVIGLSGRAVGTVVLSLSKEVALKAASTMLMMEATEVDEEVLDAVGELTNMVAGGAKAELEEYELAVSLPNVITGRDHEIHFPSSVQPICIPFNSPWGEITLEVGLSQVAAPVAS
ncbi:MAG: chemotaxis protein CheX [Planctomycetota bacterium]|nr:chemotaxis protein CheX [Planctomycetota bacterium]